MTKHIVKTMKRVIVGGLCGFLSITGPSFAASEPQQATTLTVIKEWSPEFKFNEGFEADRRAWLASLRAQRVEIDPDEIVEEELEPLDLPSAQADEFSRDILNGYIDTISAEINQSQK